MKLITNRISTGNRKSFDEFIADYKKEHQIKTASVKTAAEQEEADSSGQLDVEPLHQTGESTTMPKAGPSAKKDDGEKSATATKSPDEEGPDSGQPKAEGTEKFTNDPEVPSKEEKGGSTKAGVKVAEATCEKCKSPCAQCKCDNCDCKSCTAHSEAQVKKAALEDLPEAVQDKIKGKKTDDSDDSDDSDEEKEAKVDEDDKEEKEAKVDEDDKEEKEAKVDEDDKEEKEASAKCEECKCDPCECKKASKKVEYVKIANLDAKNKSFLTEYWRQLFGDDYVNALVADK